MEIYERGEDPLTLSLGLALCLCLSLPQLAVQSVNCLVALVLTAYCCHLPLPLVPAASEPGA